MIKTANIKSRVNHDSMWISCTFPSGGNFKYRVTRYDSRLTIAFSDNEPEGKLQMETFQAWLKRTHTTSYGNLFKELERICNTCTSGKELIGLMKK